MEHEKNRDCHAGGISEAPRPADVAEGQELNA